MYTINTSLKNHIGVGGNIIKPEDHMYFLSCNAHSLMRVILIFDFKLLNQHLLNPKTFCLK